MNDADKEEIMQLINSEASMGPISPTYIDYTEIERTIRDYLLNRLQLNVQVYGDWLTMCPIIDGYYGKSYSVILPNTSTLDVRGTDLFRNEIQAWQNSVVMLRGEVDSLKCESVLLRSEVNSLKEAVAFLGAAE